MSINKMIEQERRKYLYFEAFYLKVKEQIKDLEEKLDLHDSSRGDKQDDD